MCVSHIIRNISTSFVDIFNRRRNFHNTEFKGHVATIHTLTYRFYYMEILRTISILLAVPYFRRLLAVQSRVQSQQVCVQIMMEKI
jgi:hypothetical protein